MRQRGGRIAQYKDLKIPSIDGRTGSEAGVVNSISEYISKNISLHTTNLRTEPESMKIGDVIGF